MSDSISANFYTKYYFKPTREAERLPYNVRYNIFVGTGVPDCPFGRKCYFMTARDAEDVVPYNLEINTIKLVE